MTIAVCTPTYVYWFVGNDPIDIGIHADNFFKIEK